MKQDGKVQRCNKTEMDKILEEINRIKSDKTNE